MRTRSPARCDTPGQGKSSMYALASCAQLNIPDSGAYICMGAPGVFIQGHKPTFILDCAGAQLEEETSRADMPE